MTCCVAAICENGVIFGASDRMLTAGDIEFEPATKESPELNSKMASLTNSICMLMAGDSSTQAEIVMEIAPIIEQRIQADKNRWISIKEYIDFYSHAYSAIRNRRIDSNILNQYGLNIGGFLNRQSSLEANFVERIRMEIAHFNIPLFQTIVAGIDDYGPHLYVIDNMDGFNIRNYNSIGFAAIGSGARHAELVFMAAGHNRHVPHPETALLTYVAKKRSEVAPGVGVATDMITMGPSRGSFSTVSTSVVKGLDRIYRNRLKREKHLLEREKIEMNQYIQELAARANPNQTASSTNVSPTEPPPPSDQSPDAGPSSEPPP